MLGRETLRDLFLDIPFKDNAKSLTWYCRLVTVDLHSQVRDLRTPNNRRSRLIFHRCADVLSHSFAGLFPPAELPDCRTSGALLQFYRFHVDISSSLITFPQKDANGVSMLAVLHAS